MVYFRSLIFHIFLALCLYPGLFLFSLLVILPVPCCRWVPAWWGRKVTQSLKYIVGLNYKLTGQLPPKGQPFLLISKHQSSWETHVFPYFFPRSAFVVKRDLMWVPAYGWLLWRLGMIPINRGKGIQSIRVMGKAARDMVGTGRSVVVFPEGTRTNPGDEVTYKSGVYFLYKTCNVPVIPIALNSGLFWGRRSFLKKPGTITVECLPPIPPGLEKNEFMEKLYTVIETASNRLCNEAIAPKTKVVS